MPPPPDRIRIVFDDHRLVANAGLLLPATLARHLGLRELGAVLPWGHAQGNTPRPPLHLHSTQEIGV